MQEDNTQTFRKEGEQLAKHEACDAEIDAMAQQIKQNNEKIMIQLKKLPPKYVERANVNREVENNNRTMIAEDYASMQGHFGWANIEDKNIPYLYRLDKKFVSKRIILDQHIFSTYLQLFTDGVFNCYNIRTFKATEAEANLLNEINSKHCDFHYGTNRFTPEDLLVALDDIIELKRFFEFCHSRLVKKDCEPQPCGFIRISSENYVPYVKSDTNTYLPLFYFEGDCVYLEERAVSLTGWKLSYLKLACKVQGIRNDLFNKDSLPVVDLELIKRFFVPGTLFEELWLYENETSHLIRQRDIVIDVRQIPSEVQNNRQNVRFSVTPVFRNNTPKIAPRPPSAIVRPNEVMYGIYATCLDGKMLYYCVNTEPFKKKPLAVTIEELSCCFFKINITNVMDALRAMEICVTAANRQQLAVLNLHRFNNTKGLIRVDTIQENLRQLSYMLTSI